MHATALIQRAERTALENFILAHVSPDLIIENFGSSENKKQIEQRLGLAPKVEIQEVALRTGAHSGSFDSINDETLLHILQYLGSRDRLKAVLFISQSWYSLRNTAELWQDLSIGQSYRSGGSLDCSSEGLRKLSQHLNLSLLTNLTCGSCDKGGADINAWKAFTKSLVHPLTSLTISSLINKTKLLQSFADMNLSKLEKFSLHDRLKDSNALYSMFEKMPVVKVSHSTPDCLYHLVFMSTDLPTYIGITTSHRLHHQTLEFEVEDAFDERVFRSLFRALSKARMGGKVISHYYTILTFPLPCPINMPY